MRARIAGIAALLAVSLAAIVPGLAGTVLHIGDQKGNARAVLEAAGALTDLPYEIQWHEFSAAAPLLEAATVGAIDAGTVGDAPFTFAVAAKSPIKAIVATRTGQEGLAIVVRKDAPYRSIRDLVGRKIGTGRGSIGHQLALAALEREGLKPSDVELAFLLPADAALALRKGSIDAWSTWDPYTAQLEIADGARRLVDGSALTPGLGFFFARDDALADAEKAAALRDFVSRLARSRAWGARNVDTYATSWSKVVGLPSEIGLLVIGRARPLAVPITEKVVADEQKTIDLYIRNGLIAQPLDAANVFDARFNDIVAAETLN